MSRKLIIVIVALVLLAGAGVAYYMLGANTADTSTVAAAATPPPDQVTADDHVLGSATAPVTMIEYFSQGCSVCAHFDSDVFPQLKAQYIDTGKVRYVMRLFPLFPVDGPAYKLDMCVSPSQFFQAADLLFRNQPLWDSGEYPDADANGGLLKMARIMGITPDQAAACMNSKTHDAAINKVAQDGLTRYAITGTPTFVIDYKVVDFPRKSWEDAQAAIDAALAAKGVK